MRIRCIRDFSKEFRNEWSYGFDKKIHKKGWETRIERDENFDDNGNMNLVIFPEDNKYYTNFPSHHFEIIQEENEEL